MVLLCVNIKPTDSHKLKLRFSGLGVNVQTITLCGYACSWEKLAGSTPAIPHHLIVNIEEMQSNQIHNCLTIKADGNYPHSNGLHLAQDGSLSTIKFGINIPFQLNKRIPKEMNVELFKFGAGNEIVPILTGVPTAANAILKCCILYFSYDFVSNF